MTDEAAMSLETTRTELEAEIARYRTLFWGADDQPTRDLLRKVLKQLEHQLETLAEPIAGAAEQDQHTAR
jgi:hypothetical protein